MFMRALIYSRRQLGHRKRWPDHVVLYTVAGTKEQGDGLPWNVP